MFGQSILKLTMPDTKDLEWSSFYWTGCQQFRSIESIRESHQGNNDQGYKAVIEGNGLGRCAA